MSNLAPLLGVLVGALVAATAQLWVRRSQTRERWLGELLEQCAQVYALEANFRGRAQEPDPKERRQQLEKWPRLERRVAEAKINLLTTDDRLMESHRSLREKGKACYRSSLADHQDFTSRLREHRDALDEFAKVARAALRAQRVM